MEPFNEKVLLESFANGDDKGYEYLADNTNNTVILGVLGNLSILYELSKDSVNVCKNYKDYRNSMLISRVGLTPSTVRKIDWKLDYNKSKETSEI